MYSEDELEKQGSAITSKLIWVFVPIAVLVAIIIIVQSNSLDYNRKNYEEARNVEFHGKIASKFEEGDYTRARRYLILENGYKEQVPNEIYYKMEAGDSVFKGKGKDTTYFYLKSGEVLVDDYIERVRENYLELLRDK